MINKRGQFFLLAAVIISSVLVNMGIIANQVKIAQEPKDFFGYNFMIKKESGNVIAYELSNSVINNINLTDFTYKIAIDLRDRDPDSNFMFIYGNHTNLTIANYGSERAKVKCNLGTCGTIPGSEILGGNICTSPTICYPATLWTNGRVNLTSYNLGPSPTPLEVTIGTATFNFNITAEKQLIFIMQKEINDERFIATG